MANNQNQFRDRSGQYVEQRGTPENIAAQIAGRALPYSPQGVPFPQGGGFPGGVAPAAQDGGAGDFWGGVANPKVGTLPTGPALTPATPPKS